MKKFKISLSERMSIRAGLIVSALFVSLLAINSTPAKAQVAVSFQVFYNDLAPYGTWVSYPSYGYAWVPAMGGGFRPYYTGGHWAYTDEGWMWLSDYDWGWAPFHYGTWVL